MIVCWNPFVICALFLDISSWLSQLHPHQPCHSAQVSQTISDPNWSSENDTSSHLRAMVRPRKGPWTPRQNLQRFGFRASRKKWDNWNLETKFLWFFPAEIGISDRSDLVTWTSHRVTLIDFWPWGINGNEEPNWDDVDAGAAEVPNSWPETMA